MHSSLGLNIKFLTYLTWLILSLSFTLETLAQKAKKNSIDVSYGDEYYKNGDYFKAEEFYQNAYKKQTNSSYITYRIAECNRLLFKYAKAEEFYGKTLSNTSSLADYPLAKYWFAMMRKMNGEYLEAKSSFEEFIAVYQPKTKDDLNYLEHARVEKEGCEFAILELEKPLRDYQFKILPAPVNTKFSDYSPAIYHNDTSIVITSAREETVGGDKYDATGESFSDNLRFEKNKTGSWVKSGNTDGFNELVNTKYNDGAGIFTHDKKKFYYTQCDDDQGACAIYVTKIANGKWIKPVKLNAKINDPGGWNAQPTLSFKGDTMYFVSKRKGGAGQHDIWYSISSKGEDLWDTARNLTTINTPSIDMAPNYFPNEKTLFFSSTGRKGFGGLDIYMAKGDSFKNVTNIGLPFNSNKDDFYFVVGDSLGYLTSNRDGGAGSDDIYSFTFKSKLSQLIAIKSDTVDSTAQSISVKGKVLDDSTNMGVPNLENMLADDQGNVIKKSKTNKEGNFRYENLDKNKNYKVLINEDNASLTKKKNYRVVDIKVEGSKAKVSKHLFENIYFDYDKSDLRHEGSKILDELVEYLKQNNHIQVELRANTDAIGTNNYNFELSKKRGEVAIDYLVSKGIDRSTMVVDAEGEGMPIATNSNEIGRQLNRRVEFYILGDANFVSSGMVYILQPKNTLYSIAKENGMTVEELKRYNGLEDQEVIKAYSPIRIPRKGKTPLIAPSTTEILDKSPVITESNVVKTADLKEGDDFYVVQHGNTFYSISHSFNMTVDELKAMNGITDSNVKVGQKLKVKKK